jgi:hypothetical protein
MYKAESLILEAETREEVTGDWRKLYKDEIYNLYSSPDIIWMSKSRRMRWVRHVVHMGKMRNCGWKT